MKIKKIWESIKAMVAKLLRRPGREPEPARNIALEKKLAREIQKRQARGVAKAVNTSQGGPNMPKYQPCPHGHGWKKRKRKTMGGAYYRCPIDGEFFVRAPGL